MTGVKIGIERNWVAPEKEVEYIPDKWRKKIVGQSVCSMGGSK